VLVLVLVVYSYDGRESQTFGRGEERSETTEDGIRASFFV
jgi:hypothetical protein